MMRLGAKKAVILSFFVIITACATLPLEGEIDEVLYPQGDYEECVELLPGQMLEYSFRASMPVNFNIHYHARGEVFYPVKRDHVSSLSGRIDVEELPYYTGDERYFCLMWENPHERMGVTLRCRHRVMEKRQVGLYQN